jgi:hypothetical protein
MSWTSSDLHHTNPCQPHRLPTRELFASQFASPLFVLSYKRDLLPHVHHQVSKARVGLSPYRSTRSSASASWPSSPQRPSSS